MSDEKIKWTTMQPLEVVHPGGPLDKTTATPVAIESLPVGIQKGMLGLLSACSSAVAIPFSVGSITVTGALGVARAEGATTKAYPYAMAEGPNGEKYFVACERRFDGHHCIKGMPDEKLILNQVRPDRILKKKG